MGAGHDAHPPIRLAVGLVSEVSGSLLGCAKSHCLHVAQRTGRQTPRLAGSDRDVLPGDSPLGKPLPEAGTCVLHCHRAFRALGTGIGLSAISGGWYWASHPPPAATPGLLTFSASPHRWLHSCSLLLLCFPRRPPSNSRVQQPLPRAVGPGSPPLHAGGCTITAPPPSALQSHPWRHVSCGSLLLRCAVQPALLWHGPGQPPARPVAMRRRALVAPCTPNPPACPGIPCHMQS